MKFFRYFKKIYYPASIGANGVQQDFYKCANIMTSVRFNEILQKNTVFFYDYAISDDDRPDIIASKYYGSSDYTWVVLLTNNIFDPIYDWPLTSYEFTLYLRSKYPSIEYTHQNVKQYLNANGFEIDHTSWLALPASDRSQKTIYEWENDQNEKKRNIRLLEDIYLNQVVAEFRDLMKSSQ